MPRKILQAARCSQMRNIVNGVDIGPSTATGSGGNRCTEAVSAMIDATYKLGAMAQSGKYTVEQMMYSFVTAWNGAGAINSSPENIGVKFGGWLSANGHDKLVQLKNTVWPGFSTIVDCIDRGHVAIGGFNDYIKLRLADGSLPYKWSSAPPEGHVLLIVGYDLEQQHVIVHDPLRADPGGQPADYSWKSFQNAVFHDCTEVVGAALPYTVNTAAAPAPPPAPTPTPSTGGSSMAIPTGWHDSENGDATKLGGILTASNNVVVKEGFRQWVLMHSWDAANVPQAPERVVASVSPADTTLGAGSRQDFLYSSLGWTSVHGVFPIALAHELALANNAAQTAAADNQTLQTTLKQQAAQIATLQQSPAGMSAADVSLLQAFQSWQKAKTPTVTTPLPATSAAA